MNAYAKGLQEIADGVHAYLQPDGSWGWSNAGLVVGDGSSLLVDTLFDLKLTAAMLDEMAGLTAASPIDVVVNTHANGDHCYGNQLLSRPGVDFVASAAAAREIDEVPPNRLARTVEHAGDGPLGEFMRHAFGPFALADIEVPPVTRPFTGKHEIDAGGRQVQLAEVGPAHTQGDIVAWLPDPGVVFAGDILFIGSTPIMWAGPIANWIAACDYLESLAPAVVVPGHGPLTDLAGIREVREYLSLVHDAAVERHAAGMTPEDAARDIDLLVNSTRFGSWSDRERLVVTVHAAWRDLEPGYEMPGIMALLAAMADDFVARRT